MALTLHDLPEALPYPQLMTHPNETVTIYQGEFLLKNDELELIVNGSIEFKWFPRSRPILTGETILQSIDDFMRMTESNRFSVFIERQLFSECLLIDMGFNNPGEVAKIRGAIVGRPVKGDSSIKVNTAYFYIPNLLALGGKPIKRFSGQQVQSSHSRILFETPEYNIVLDKDFEYTHKGKLLKDSGGYFFLYKGEVSKKHGSLSVNEVREILNCFSTFLSFINGRSTSSMFTHGIHENEIKWVDYTYNFIEPYVGVKHWIEERQAKHLNNIWNHFYEIWRDNDGKYVLETVVGWYLDANSLNGGLHGSIVMAQSALELIYNWLVIEKKKLISGKDAENIAASNKIRLLLSLINIDYNIPDGLQELAKFNIETDKKNQVDGPDLIVQIRNAIVHSQAEKRKNLNAIPFEVRQEALELYIWYIEMSFLFILKYEGSYINRCSSELYFHSKLTSVPWAQNK
ncbi:hypothetical protein [Pontibacter anaerobius]|uniref:YopA central domain-containing protein n=1 Tax=Pontibacter anaerobius TaxID=2993940 RepID=A0ABT3RDX4_9BACT|nr:hypothetical protein [Pontibacter anaerobius]MCX2739819.1 hypothetical protein [Pontibacter anaerobius]